MEAEIKIKFKRIDDELLHIPLPAYATKGSAGMDVHAAIKEPFIIKPGSVELIPTNFLIEIPKGYEMQVRPRSGLAIKHGMGILNSPGTIDSDYRGEVKIILFNFSKKDFVINPGDRIAQIVLSKVYKANLVESKELNNTKRGAGGFGHTGR
ncbi:MAG: dUTP diphosphatase [Ignavibacteria bacterium]|nr:dUTP diphosphatase [Ignavibacteria bacterium]MBT8383606.1 dUTP diphosphatase [Ignavibacteria bacterium]MBT8390732.1 dUTP diphosphatase [Ignavibacteria bacterium]NNJ53493.1 dUTP diphosphatase [Ignavibacteriaceae bacterium]NNL20951.1 dUTP diphosphatase [Ignavibacteriaceae bacterium]